MNNALTPDEWTRGGFGDGISAYILPEEPDNAHCVAAFTDGELRASCEDCTTWRQGATFTDRRHALAALALRDQPFGFTHADVTCLRSFLAQSDPGTQAGIAMNERLYSLADRIEALLPPR